MEKIISAFKVVKPFPPFEVGEVFEVSRYFAITSLDTRVGIKIVKELFKAAVGEPAAFELAYSDRDSSTSCTSSGRLTGIIYLGMDTFDCPTVDIRGPILYSDPHWCSMVNDACDKNDRYALDSLVFRRDDVAFFISEPGTGCLFTPYFCCAQLVCSSARAEHGDAYLAVEAHATVDRGYLVRKRHKALQNLYSGRLDGYVLKVAVQGVNPCVFSNTMAKSGSYVFYSGGAGYLVSHPCSAFIYKTRQSAIDSAPRGIHMQHRCYAGGKIGPFRLDRGQLIKPEVITTEQLRKEIWGNQTGINYFQEIAKA